MDICLRLRMRVGLMERNYFRLSCLAVFVAVLALASACKGATDGQPVRNTGHYAIIETERGTFVVELYPKVAPKTVGNFETLVGKGFYNGLTWHRVVPDFVVQGGDPDGTGMGGPGYNVPAEIDKNEHHLRGSLATARKGDDARAIADVTKATEIDPKFADAYVARANIHARNGNFDRTIADAF